MRMRLFFWRMTLLFGTFFSLLAVGRVVNVVIALRIPFFQPKWLLLICFFGLTTLVELLFFGLTWNKKVQRFLESLSNYSIARSGLRVVGIIFALLILGGYTWSVLFSPFRGFLMSNSSETLMVLGTQNGTLKVLDTANGGFLADEGYPLTGDLINSGIQWWSAWVCVIVAGILIKICRKNGSVEQSTFIALLGLAVIHQVFFYVPLINGFPFSQSWSEGSRWYYASLVASKQVYGFHLAPSLIDYPLDILNSLPYFLGSRSIIIMRLWSNILMLSTTMTIAILLARRLHIPDQWLRLALTAWCFLYFFQENTIYPHLLLAVIVVLFLSSGKRPWLTLAGVMVTSFWVGMDRINWYPVPSMIAITLYLLEERVQDHGALLKYLAKPILWTIGGLGTALLGAFVVLKLTGADISITTSSFTSPLLWYRLLPNPTFPFGILPAILCISLPLWILIGWRMQKSAWHPIRIFGLLAILFVLFIGGLVSSIKIGGGSDLHNLDVYLMLLLIVATYVFAGKFEPDSQITLKPLPWLTIVIVIIFPVFMKFQNTQLTLLNHQQAADHEIQQINSLIKSAAGHGEVLFISQRQLITFGYVKGFKLVPDYDIVTLMEMVMSGNQGYLSKFQDDITNHRFSLIIVEPQRIRMESPNRAFSDENNIWVNTITTPFLCNYQSVMELPIAGVNVYQPIQNNQPCP